MAFHAPKIYMVEHPILGMGSGNNGYFKISRKKGVLQIIASDGAGWEHVSVSMTNGHTPTWEDMCFVKDLFWDEEDCVIQYHPPKSQYVNNVNNCLHLWKKIGYEFETPPSLLVGVK